jgi:hypothetical protein
MNSADKRIEIMRKIETAGFNGVEVDAYFVEKGWLKAGQVFPDLSDFAINKIYESYDLFVTGFTAWKKQREAGKK